MARLEIGSWDSTCGNCRRPANPFERGHYTLLGYGKDNGQPGCGEEWTDATMVYYMGARDYAKWIEDSRFPEFIKDLLRKRIND